LQVIIGAFLAPQRHHEINGRNRYADADFRHRRLVFIQTNAAGTW